MDPLITGALIGAGSSLLGGLFGSKSAQSVNETNLQNQREFAQYGIRWRMEDARHAGVHPLFAIGAQTQGYTPSPVVPGDAMGQAISDAGQQIGRAYATRDGRNLEQMQMKLLESQIRNQDADTLRLQSEAMRARQEAMRQAPWIRDTDLVDPISGAVTRPVNPDEIIELGQLDQYSGTPSQRPGIHSGYDRFNMGNFQMLLPSSGSGSGSPTAAEALEGISESIPLMAMVIQRNMDEFGPGWLDSFERNVGGIKQFKEAIDMVKVARDRLYSLPGRAWDAVKSWAAPDSSRRNYKPTLPWSK